LTIAAGNCKQNNNIFSRNVTLSFIGYFVPGGAFFGGRGGGTRTGEGCGLRHGSTGSTSRLRFGGATAFLTISTRFHYSISPV
jgi:hypothetical protein